VTAHKHPQGDGGGPADSGRLAPVKAKAAAINSAQAPPLTWKTVVKRATVVAVAGLAIYLVLPKLTAVLASWPRLSTLNPVWFTAAAAAEVVSFACNFALQRLALRSSGWFAVVTAGLAGNAVTDSLPGGDAAGAALQFSMLSTAGFDTDTAVGGLAAFSLLGVGGLLALPILALPAMLAGAPVSPGLADTALFGIAGFVLFAIFGVVLLYTDRPLAAVGCAAQSLRNWITRGHRPPMTGLDNRMLDERDTIRTVLGKKWWQAVLLTAGRLGFDFGCLLCVLRATGAHPAPLPRTAGLLRHRHHRAPPVHSGGPRHCGGEPERPADPGRRPPRRRRPGHPRLPGRLLLAPPPRGAAGLPALPPPHGTQASHPPDHQGTDADSEHHPRADGTTD
jgi:hypothetical protein